ncbi:sulfur carrier protein ThiS [Nocardioides jiangxiensis]|uniref:Sulfur carrier protein ThiS n=1 Tax=Nocardioides jiangxiensis TaxID=3064524 RepID=A0ABT9B203_9ACTN|nr:sulfur carrier protein ThiS [Nocardioides sp. WY-20]MDO7868879.1 sulfur carrier protein ThiS [Nocardioides sp. WY-20]
MNLTVNGSPRACADAATVASLVADVLGGPVQGSAVAVNGEVVPRAAHTATRLNDGDVVEIVTAVQGG